MTKKKTLPKPKHPAKKKAGGDCPSATCSAIDLANGLRHAADDHNCCKATLTMAADAIIQMSQALHNLAQPLGRTDYTIGKLDGIIRKIAADALIFKQNVQCPSKSGK
jgi:hypothetical protein